MEDRRRSLLLERDRTVALLKSLEFRIAQLDQEQLDLVCQIADAEDRGDWLLAARLRTDALVAPTT